MPLEELTLRVVRVVQRCAESCPVSLGELGAEHFAGDVHS